MYEPVFTLERLRLESFAKSAGYDLAAVFVEEIDGSLNAFGLLLDAVIQDQAGLVIVPSMLHLITLGSPDNIRGHVEAATGARVIVAA